MSIKTIKPNPWRPNAELPRRIGARITVRNLNKTTSDGIILNNCVTGTTYVFDPHCAREIPASTFDAWKWRAASSHKSLSAKHPSRPVNQTIKSYIKAGYRPWCKGGSLLLTNP